MSAEGSPLLRTESRCLPRTRSAPASLGLYAAVPCSRTDRLQREEHPSANGTLYPHHRRLPKRLPTIGGAAAQSIHGGWPGGCGCSFDGTGDNLEASNGSFHSALPNKANVLIFAATPCISALRAGLTSSASGRQEALRRGHPPWRLCGRPSHRPHPASMAWPEPACSTEGARNRSDQRSGQLLRTSSPHRCRAEDQRAATTISAWTLRGKAW